MKVKVKTKIRYNGREYSSPDELPPEVRASYAKAMGGAAKSKIVINGQEFATETYMPDNMRNFYDDMIDLVQNNGEVTLPTMSRASDPLVTKRQIKLILAVAGALILVALAFAAKSIS